MKDSVELGPVQETLLIPLLGRAAESRKPNGMLYDAKALELVDRLLHQPFLHLVAFRIVRTRLIQAPVRKELHPLAVRWG